MTVAHPLLCWVRDLNAEGIEPHPGPRYVTKNVNGMMGNGKRIIRAIHTEHERDPITAVFIQEHNLSPKRARKLAGAARSKNMLAIFDCAQRGGHGVHWGGTAIIIPHSSIEQKAGETITEARERVSGSRKGSFDGRIVSVQTLVDGQRRRLVSAYAPARSGPGHPRTAFYENLDTRLSTNTVLGIDANSVPDTRLDLKRDATSPYDNEGADRLDEAIDNHNLIDVARAALGSNNPAPFFTAHHVGRAGDTWSRIDRIYIPDNDKEAWSHTECNDFFPRPIHRIELDHVAVHVRTEIIPHERGDDVKYIDESVFDNRVFVDTLFWMINKTYAREKTQPTHLQKWRDAWERLKAEVKEACFTETTRLRKSKRSTNRALKAILKQLRATALTGDADATRRADALEKRIREEESNNRTIHERLEEHAYNNGKRHDVGSKEFFRQWDPSRPSEAPRKMKRADWSDPSAPVFEGGIADTVSAVLDVFTKYYTALFSRKDPLPAAAHKCYNALADGPQVLPPTAAKCDAEIAVEELEEVLRDLPTGKSPGPDRIPNKFYKTYSKILSEFLAYVFNESRHSGALPQSCMQGLISVLYKKKDREDPRNYRPITLLNCDYKILTRILTKRMNEAALQFVSPCQNGFVPGGFIAENIMLLKLIQSYVEEQREDALFLFLDMEKACA